MNIANKETVKSLVNIIMHNARAVDGAYQTLGIDEIRQRFKNLHGAENLDDVPKRLADLKKAGVLVSPTKGYYRVRSDEAVQPAPKKLIEPEKLPPRAPAQANNATPQLEAVMLRLPRNLLFTYTAAAAAANMSVNQILVAALALTAVQARDSKRTV